MLSFIVSLIKLCIVVITKNQILNYYDNYYFKGSELAKLYQSFICDYPIVSIEDGFDQDDWSSWTNFTASTKIQVHSQLIYTTDLLYVFV